jgi:hypothetical protein
VDSRGGNPSWEGTKQRPGEPAEEIVGLDSLYTADTWDRSLEPGCEDLVSPARGAICALRYRMPGAETLPGRKPGRLVVFDFQPFWFQPGPIRSDGTAAIDWLMGGED